MAVDLSWKVYGENEDSEIYFLSLGVFDGREPEVLSKTVTLSHNGAEAITNMSFFIDLASEEALQEYRESNVNLRRDIVNALQFFEIDVGNGYEKFTDIGLAGAKVFTSGTSLAAETEMDIPIRLSIITEGELGLHHFTLRVKYDYTV